MFWKFLRTKRPLIVAFIIAFLMYISYQLSENLPDLFPPYGELLFDVSSKLSLSIMSGVILYYITTFMPDFYNKKRIYSYVQNHMRNILRNHYMIMEQLLLIAKFKTENKDFEDLNQEYFDYLCDHISSSDITDVCIGYSSIIEHKPVNICQLLDHNIEASLVSIQKIISNSLYIEDDLKVIIYKLEVCGLFEMHNLIQELAGDTVNLGFLSKQLFSYHRIIWELRFYDLACVYNQEMKAFIEDEKKAETENTTQKGRS